MELYITLEGNIYHQQLHPKRLEIYTQVPHEGYVLVHSGPPQEGVVALKEDGLHIDDVLVVPRDCLDMEVDVITKGPGPYKTHYEPGLLIRSPLS